MLKTNKVKIANCGINKFTTNNLINNFMFITTYVFVNKQNIYKKKQHISFSTLFSITCGEINFLFLYKIYS